jgi:predicted nucleic acid-binding protein
VALVLDTGPLLASIDRGDAQHQACVRLLESTVETLLIPSPVLSELDYWLGAYGGPPAQAAFVDDLIDGTFVVENLEAEDYLRIRDLIGRYADARIGFVDAAVLAVVERLREPKLATLDRRHFGLLRPRHVEALRLLPD